MMTGTWQTLTCGHDDDGAGDGDDGDKLVV